MLYPLAETTECDFKRELETKKPKSWLKSVSAFANGIGRKLIFGIDDSGEIVGVVPIEKAPIVNKFGGCTNRRRRHC